MLLLAQIAPAQDSPDPRSDSTIAMAERLARLADEFEARSFPDAPFFGVDTPWQIPALRQKVAAADSFGARLDARFRLAQQLLWSGQSSAALAEFEEMDTAAMDLRPGDERRVLEMLRPWVVAAHLASRPRSSLGLTSDPQELDAAIAVLERSAAAEPEGLSARWLLLLASLAQGERLPDLPERLGPGSPGSSFSNVAASAGVDVVGRAGGSVLDDLDGDGDLDLIVSSWGPRDQLRLFLNSGDGSFMETTTSAGLEGITGGLSLNQADYDNDGALDVLVLRGGWLQSNAIFPNSLLRNRGDGSFEDVTVRAGLDFAEPGHTAAWADYDGDGDLDLFLGHEWSTADDAHPSMLMRNRGDGSFEDVAGPAGLAELGWVKAAAWADYDNDDRPDLFVSRLGQPNLLMNNAGPVADGAFRFFDVADVTTVQEPRLSLTSVFFDYDNDGWLDLFSGAWDGASLEQIAAIELGLPASTTPGQLFHNERTGVFRDVTQPTGIEAFYTLAAESGDLDGDGFEDLYLGTGGPHMPTLAPNRLLLGQAGRRFDEATRARGLGLLPNTTSLSFGDVDGDGDQDVYAVIGGWYSGDTGANVLLANPGTGRRWLTLRLVGVESNRSAIGARIDVHIESPAGPRRVHRSVGAGSSSLQQEIGLGDATAITAIEIHWPATGRTQRVEDAPLDSVVSIHEGATDFLVIR